MKINEKIKTFFICIGVFIAGVFGFIFRDLLHNKRNTTDENRDRVEQLKKEAEQQQRDNRETVSGIDEAIGIITEIKKEQRIQN